jgi:hypothetical protein
MNRIPETGVEPRACHCDMEKASEKYQTTTKTSLNVQQEQTVSDPASPSQSQPVLTEHDVRNNLFPFIMILVNMLLIACHVTLVIAIGDLLRRDPLPDDITIGNRTYIMRNYKVVQGLFMKNITDC